MTQETPKPRYIEMVYSGHTTVDLEEVMEETGIEFNVEDVRVVHVKWNTVWIVLNNGVEIEYEFENYAHETMDYKRPDRASLLTEEMLQISRAGYAERLTPDEPTRFEKAVMPALKALIYSRQVTDFKVDDHHRLYNKGGNRVRVTPMCIDRVIKAITG
jgi:hypothetical protein